MAMLLMLVGVPAVARQRSWAALEVLGHGPVAVFESGSGEALGSWAAVVHKLTACLTTVTYDRPGVGASQPRTNPAAPVLAAQVAGDLLAALRARGLPGPYILVGHSIGGLYVQAFARDHPAAVAGVVLVDASSPLEPPGTFVSTKPPKPGSIEAAEDAGVGPSVAALQRRPFPPVPLVVIAATDHADTPAREKLWREVQARTARLSPKGRLVVVHSGHFVQLDRPDVVAAAVLAVAAKAGADVAACRH